jgi:hypothetical protein
LVRHQCKAPDDVDVIGSFDLSGTSSAQSA